MRNNENQLTKSSPNYVYGRNTSLAALENKKAIKVFLQNGFNEPKILEQIKKQNIVPQYIDLNHLNQISKNANHQGVVVEVKPYEYCSVDEIIRSSKNKNQPLVLILDEVEDPHNFGAILRSCDAFGVDGVIIKSRNQVPLNMTVAKVSTGAVDYVKVAQVSNLSAAIKKLKENNFWVYAAEGSGSEDYSKVDYAGAVALVVGSEGRGISKLVLDNSDFVIKIPMTGHVNSLNVSVSVGILLSRIRS